MVYTRTNTGAWALEYLHRDHLGSITAVTDATGKLLAEYSYDAWGRQRDPANQLAYAPDKAPEPRHGRGYTSHEHLPQFGLVNMNARLYDPVLGRFLSPDPYVQAPNWSQSFNRYSYCGNNPLMFTDEDGEFFTILAAIFCPVLLPVAIQTDIGWIMGGIGAVQNGGQFWQGALVGGAIGAVNGGLSMMSPLQVPLGSGFGLGIAPQIAVGTDGLGFGLNASLGYNLGKGFNVGVNVGATYYASAAGTNQGGLEGRAGYGIGYKTDKFQAGIGTTYFFSGETSQQTGQMYIGGSNWKATYENDTWAPVPGLIQGKGPDGDKYRTAAFRFEMTGGRLKGASAGGYIFTGKTGGSKGEGVFRETGTQHRMGVLYLGYMEGRIGYNSEKNVRAPIQNGFHDLMNYPHFEKRNIVDKFYGGYYSLNPYTLW